MKLLHLIVFFQLSAMSSFAQDNPINSTNRQVTLLATKFSSIVRYADGNGSEKWKRFDIESALEEDCTKKNAETALGEDDIIPITDINIFPNPSNGNFTLTRASQEPCRVEVVDNTGRTVFSQEDLDGVALELDLGNQPAGVYTLRVFEPNQRCLVKRLIIQ